MGALKFPKDFLWGAATSAHQVEGNNVNSDWWEWEEEYAGKKDGPSEKSGIACDSYTRFEEDFTLAESMKHNAHRLSIEWARIEPEEGKFNEEEIEHYRKVLQSARRHGLKTFVTLWHFTLPKWLRKSKGIGNIKTPYYFERYATYVVERLGSDMDYIITLNEPVVYVTMRHLTRQWLPQQDGHFIYFIDAWISLLRCHLRAYKAIKAINKEYKVGVVENVMYVEPMENSLLSWVTSEIRKYMQFRIFLGLAMVRSDFIGVNYYFHDLVGPVEFFFSTTNNKNEEVSDWGWEIFPSGIYHVVKEVSRYKKPIYITENGLADAFDSKRESFIVRHLYWLHKAISEGVDVRGYMHWSLLDNFEWAEGFKRRFGLVEVDRQDNLKRKPRESSKSYSRICESNELPADLLEKYKLQ